MSTDRTSNVDIITDTTTVDMANSNMTDTINVMREFDIYDIDTLLDRAYGLFTLDRSRTKITPPEFVKKDRKSYIQNFLAVCKSIDRDPEEIKKFLSRELNMETSFKESGVLKIDAIVKNAGIIEKLITNYVKDYVQCKSCSSCKTITERVDRLTYLVCKTCGARLTITKDF